MGLLLATCPFSSNRKINLGEESWSPLDHRDGGRAGQGPEFQPSLGLAPSQFQLLGDIETCGLLSVAKRVILSLLGLTLAPRWG